MIGSHLAKVLDEQGVKVAGLSRATSAARHIIQKPFYRHYQGDILDTKFLENAWKDWQPDLVYHLAAQAYNGESWRAEETTYLLNIQGTRNVLNVCRDLSPGARVIPACSSAEYGFVPDHLIPIDEELTPLKPITPYGVTKAATEMMARQYHLNYGLDVVLPRMFIHVGPDHPPVTALQNFARQLAAIKLKLQEPVIKVGNLESARDFVDVRDGSKALWLLAQKGENGEAYNICSGKAWTIKESLNMLIEISGLDVEVITDPDLFRPSDEKMLLGKPDKLNALGWYPEIPFVQTLGDIFSNWLERLSK